MSTKRTNVAEDPATPKPAAKKKPAAEPKPSDFVRKIHSQVNGRLEQEFGFFCKNGTVEEKRLMIEIFNEHMNAVSSARPRGPIEHEVPLYSAIQRQLTYDICAVVPHDEMMPAVEDFINRLNRNWRSASSNRHMTQQERRDHHASAFRSEVELFARDADESSVFLMRDVLARWNEIARDPETGKIPNILAAAVEIELDVLRARAAAEAARQTA